MAEKGEFRKVQLTIRIRVNHYAVESTYSNLPGIRDRVAGGGYGGENVTMHGISGRLEITNDAQVGIAFVRENYSRLEFQISCKKLVSIHRSMNDVVVEPDVRHVFIGKIIVPIGRINEIDF